MRAGWGLGEHHIHLRAVMAGNCETPLSVKMFPLQPLQPPQGLGRTNTYWKAPPKPHCSLLHPPLSRAMVSTDQ